MFLVINILETDVWIEKRKGMYTVIGRLPQLFRTTSKNHPSDRDTVYF
jgi:hypothetical protein